VRPRTFQVVEHAGNGRPVLLGEVFLASGQTVDGKFVGDYVWALPGQDPEIARRVFRTPIAALEDLIKVLDQLEAFRLEQAALRAAGG
jgi:hypothetical protein